MAISCAMNSWNSVSLIKIASIVPLTRVRLSLRLLIAEDDISADVFLATENTTVPKIQKTNIIEISKEPFPFLFGFLFIVNSDPDVLAEDFAFLYFYILNILYQNLLC